MRANDEHATRPGRLVTEASLRWWNADELGGNGSRTTGKLCCNDGFDVVDTDQNVLWLEVGMNDAAVGVEVVQSKEDLLCYLLDNVLGHTAMLVALDETE